MGNGLARFSVLLSVGPFGTSSDSGAEQLFPDGSATEPLKFKLVGFVHGSIQVQHKSRVSRRSHPRKGHFQSEVHDPACNTMIHT
jgi:hypothetical protein